jgi:hypothetical protein
MNNLIENKYKEILKLTCHKAMAKVTELADSGHEPRPETYTLMDNITNDALEEGLKQLSHDELLAICVMLSNNIVKQALINKLINRFGQ